MRTSCLQLSALSIIVSAALANPLAYWLAAIAARSWRESPAGAAADLLELAEEQIDLLGLRVEVRRDPDPRAGAVIAEELAAVELAAHVGGAREVEHDRAAALVGRARAVELQAQLVD